MIDIHCHILPGIDDGPSTMDESVEMCRAASADGIRAIVATPHFSHSLRLVHTTGIRRLVRELNRHLKNAGVPLTILPGTEAPVVPELHEYLAKGEILTINDSKRYLLVEFHPHVMPLNWDKFFLSLMEKAVVPVIAHPERNEWFIRNIAALYSAVKNGVLVQITAMSITGQFGEEIRAFASRLLEHNLVHAIATDAHSSAHRPPVLSAAVSAASEIIGAERAMELVGKIPQAITEGAPLSVPEPVKMQMETTTEKKWVRRLFH